MTSSSSSNEIYLAAVEGGGTTFVVSVARVVLNNNNNNNANANNNNDNDGNNTILQIGPTTLQVLHTATLPPSPDLAWTPSQILDETCNFLRKHRPQSNNNSYAAVGIATFGPAGVNPSQSQTYGTILAGSPKKEWRNVDLLTPIVEACGLANHVFATNNGVDNGVDNGDGSRDCGTRRVGFDTDVNAPALAEFRHRCFIQQQKQQQQQEQQNNIQQQHNNNQNQTKTKTRMPPPPPPLTSLAYITIGTGVGVGLILNSLPLHGLLHPEGGHVAIQPLPHDTFGGYSWGKEKSPYGGVGTVEGIASSVALTERWLLMEKEEKGEDDEEKGEKEKGEKEREEKESSSSSSAQTREILSTLPNTHPLWLHASNAIANLCVSLLLLNSVQTIVLGGGIMKRTILFDMVRTRVWELLNGYLESVSELSCEEELKKVIVGSSWSENDGNGGNGNGGGCGSGLAGAFALALDAHEKEMQRNNGTGASIGNSGINIDGINSTESMIMKDVDAADAALMVDKKNHHDAERIWFSTGFWAGVAFSLGVGSLASAVLGRGMVRKH